MALRTYAASRVDWQSKQLSEWRCVHPQGRLEFDSHRQTLFFVFFCITHKPRVVCRADSNSRKKEVDGVIKKLRELVNG